MIGFFCFALFGGLSGILINRTGPAEIVVNALSNITLSCLVPETVAELNDLKVTYAVYVNVAPGKPQTGWIKLKISPGTGEAKFLQGEGKKCTGWGCTGSVTQGFDTRFISYGSFHLFDSCQQDTLLELCVWNHDMSV